MLPDTHGHSLLRISSAPRRVTLRDLVPAITPDSRMSIHGARLICIPVGWSHLPPTPSHFPGLFCAGDVAPLHSSWDARLVGVSRLDVDVECSRDATRSCGLAGSLWAQFGIGGRRRQASWFFGLFAGHSRFRRLDSDEPKQHGRLGVSGGVAARRGRSCGGGDWSTGAER